MNLCFVIATITFVSSFIHWYKNSSSDNYDKMSEPWISIEIEKNEDVKPEPLPVNLNEDNVSDYSHTLGEKEEEKEGEKELNLEDIRNKDYGNLKNVEFELIIFHPETPKENKYSDSSFRRYNFENIIYPVAKYLPKGLNEYFYIWDKAKYIDNEYAGIKYFKNTYSNFEIFLKEYNIKYSMYFHDSPIRVSNGYITKQLRNYREKYMEQMPFVSENIPQLINYVTDYNHVKSVTLNNLELYKMFVRENTTPMSKQAFEKWYEDSKQILRDNLEKSFEINEKDNYSEFIDDKEEDILDLRPPTEITQ